MGAPQCWKPTRPVQGKHPAETKGTEFIKSTHPPGIWPFEWKKKSQQRFLTFPKPVSLPTVLFFQNDQASSICCPFPNKLSWFPLQRPQNPALLAIPGCKLLLLLLGSHSSQESGYTSQHQEEEFKTLATLFRLVLVGGDTKKILLWKKTL